MKRLILAATILGTALGHVQSAQAGHGGGGAAIAAAVGFVAGAAVTAAVCDTPRCYAPVTYTYAPVAPAPVVYAAPPPVVYAPPRPPVVVYRRAVVAAPAPVVYAPVVYGAPCYRHAPRMRVAVRGCW